MKLYATVTSERASKGQGGNKYLKTTYSVGSSEDSSPIANVELLRDGNHFTLRVYDYYGKEVAQIERTKGACPKCGVIHDVDEAGGHDMIEAETVAICECREFPDDEYCKELLKGEKQKGETKASDVCPDCGILYGDCHC